MPVNRYALIRYRTIDKCLGDRFRKWTLMTLALDRLQSLEEDKTNLTGKIILLILLLTFPMRSVLPKPLDKKIAK